MTATPRMAPTLLALMGAILLAFSTRPSEGFRSTSFVVSSSRRSSSIMDASTAPLVLKMTSDPSQEDSASSEGHSKAAVVTAWATTASALLIPVASAWAAATDDNGEYVYGAVDAPVGLALGAGILAIATAALPVLLRGGEEAFEEIRERDAGTFGATDKNKDVLKSRRK